MHHHRVLALLGASLALCVQQCAAERTFSWKLGNNLVSDTFATCQNVPIVVTPINSSVTDIGVAPYTMYAFQPGGIPTMQNIGSDPNNLTWQVDHSSGAQLMLIVVDSKNNTGGIPATWYNVKDGTSDSCVKSTPSDLSTVPTISPNVTGKIETCACWGLTVKNGTSPYTIVLSALDSPVITMIPMDPGDDVLTWPDRADPNRDLIASVYDANGQWGISTSPITPFGSTNVDCIGLVANSKTTAEVQKQEADAAQQLADEKRHHRTTTILGAILGTLIPLLVIASAVFWWWRRRKLQNDHSRGIWDGQDTVVRAWDAPAPSPGSGQTEMREATSPPFSSSPSSKSLTSYPGTMPSGGHTVPLLQQSSSGRSPSDYWAGTSSTSPSSADYSNANASSLGPPPTADLTPAQRKAFEARGERFAALNPQGSSASLRHLASSSSQLPPGASPAVPPGMNMGSLDPDVQPDIIIQHRDGGSGVVQELPPPYIDRSAGAGSSGQPQS
ncbi:hypothetical protein QCA50_018002 [Cerrena zonata]|uniref:Uncharacterized protein n=1 Tax=Cerrena zonata TaxID=2478898 RepID=A0AAW0FC37_9APHY